MSDQTGTTHPDPDETVNDLREVAGWLARSTTGRRCMDAADLIERLAAENTALSAHIDAVATYMDKAYDDPRLDPLTKLAARAWARELRDVPGSEQ